MIVDPRGISPAINHQDPRYHHILGPIGITKVVYLGRSRSQYLMLLLHHGGRLGGGYENENGGSQTEENSWGTCKTYDLSMLTVCIIYIYIHIHTYIVYIYIEVRYLIKDKDGT